jgi:hypothetical protein
MTTDTPIGGEGPHVTVTRITEVVEVIDTVEVVETVDADGEVERDVIAVDHVESESVEIASLEWDADGADEVDIESTEVAAVDGVGSIADDERVATQGALPLDVRTGDLGVDAAVAQLRDLDERPVAEHAEVFTAVHRALQDALVDLDRS